MAKLTDKFELTIADMKNLFMSGMDREREDTLVDTDELEEDDREALDFGDYIKSAHNINLGDE